MPLYSWRGVDHQGNSYTGKNFARSSLELKALLVKDRIGLVQAQPVLQKAPTSSEKDAFFTQLAALLSAHLPLYEALTTMKATTLGAHALRIDDMARQVEQGIPLSQVLEHHRMLDPVARSLVTLGEKTGSLGSVLEQLVAHKNQMAQSATQIRQAMLMPGITLGFFCIALLSLVLWVIPQFNAYVSMHQIQVPYATQVFLAWGAGITTEKLIKLVACFILLLGFIKGVRYTSLGKRVLEKLLDTIPFIGSLKKLFICGRILKVLGMLLKQGIPLSSALEVCGALEAHTGYKKALTVMKEDVDKGIELHVAWKDTLFTCSKIEALLLLGHTTGKLADMMLHAAGSTQKKSFEWLGRSIALIQPLLLLSIAGLVAGLIFSLYMPLITLASSM